MAVITEMRGIIVNQLFPSPTKPPTPTDPPTIKPFLRYSFPAFMSASLWCQQIWLPYYTDEEIGSSSYTMRGHDWINTALPDELIVEIFRCLDSKLSRDACSLVCRRWLKLERLSRTTLRIGATGSPDLFVQLLARRFVNVRNVHIDERLAISFSLHPVSNQRSLQFSTWNSFRFTDNALFQFWCV